MKILLANYRYFVSGGPERYLFNVKKELEKKDHQIIPFSVKYRTNRDTAYAKYFVKPLGAQGEVYFDQQKMTPKTFFRTLSRLFYSKEVEQSVTNLIHDTHPQIAYVLHYLRKISPSLLVALKKNSIPIIVRLSDYAMMCPQAHCLRDDQTCTLCINGTILNSIKYNCVRNSRPASILNALATWFHNYKGYFDLIDNFVTTNDFMYQMMLEAGWPEAKLSCIPTFTDIHTFCPSKHYFKKDYICYAGRLDNSKGLHVLIDAFIKMKMRTSNSIDLKIAGTGPDFYIKILKSKISDANMDGSIQFVGTLDARSLSNFLNQALFTVIPSLWFENLPNSILESFASATPVIASDIGSLRGCVKKGVTGDLFTPGNSSELADMIEFYLSNLPLIKKMAVQSRNEAVNTYSPHSHMKRLDELFNKFV